MQDFEKLGVFYLGTRFDADAKTATPDLVLYDAKDLVTHALCVGMTGSGKTGLGISVIEEAAIDGVPVVAIDPKGDLTNLLLTFPELRPEDFEPWVDEDAARRAGQSRAEYAAAEAARWKEGLQKSGEDGARIKRLRDAADFTIYTPGSSAGVQISVLSSFAAPASLEPELLRERAQTTVSSLLALAGVDAEPMKSREHILLTTILIAAWQAGESLDIAGLIQRVQQPPLKRVGVLDLETFFPAADRMSLAMTLNALVASPGFEVWTEGEPLDVPALLRTAAGKPRVAVFSIAHLDDSQRMFFVALLLNAVAAWMRTQTGTSSLRALVYMDEIFGFFPPVANPPAKTPLLTLLKQGRAAGVGVVLATQNPVDLDYKGLSNIGTWWLGRLQTERDKARVLDGLESAAGSGELDRGAVDRLLSGLGHRLFLMRNVHEDNLTLFQSRWSLSYLRGPLSRDEIRSLTPTRAPGAVAARASAASPSPTAAAAASGARAGAGAAAAGAVTASETRPSLATAGSPRPPLAAGVAQYFSPTADAAGTRPLKPVLYGAAHVRYVDPKLKIDTMQLVTMTTPIVDGAVPIDWANATRVDWTPEMLEHDAPEHATFADVPAAAVRAASYAQWSRQFAAWIAASEGTDVFRSRATGEVSRPDESERDFRARLQQASREARDRALDALRRKYAPRQAALEEKLRRARQAVDRETEQATGQKLQTAISVGATLVGALLGRKAINVGTLGRATTAARGVGRSMKESEDIERAKGTLAAVEEQQRQLENDLRAETATLEATDAATEQLERISVKPKKTNVEVKLVALVWTADV